MAMSLWKDELFEKQNIFRVARKCLDPSDMWLQWDNDECLALLWL